VRDEPVARRKSATLEHVVEDQQHGEKHDQPSDKGRTLRQAGHRSDDNRPEPEKNVDYGTSSQADRHMPPAVRPVCDYAVDKPGCPIDDPDQSHDDSKSRLSNPILSCESGDCE